LGEIRGDVYMKNKIFTLLLIAITVFTITFQAFCEDLKVSGNVDQINIKFATFVICAKEGGWKVFATDSKTIMTKGGKKIKIEDIKKDEFVSVVYETMRNGASSKDVAKTVIVEEKKEISKGTKKKR